MAMPTDFWRNDQMLNIFRTKPCQRLARDGVCGWRSQCQFSHELNWPRRQPRRYNYSPEVCPHVRVIEGTERIENNCTAGLRCPWAHSKEEVLFHPHIFKTQLCEEHMNNTGNAKEKTRNAKKNRCHRYYCPFAHGNDELRTSPLSTEQRERCIRAMELFPCDVCCAVCTRHWLTPVSEQKEEPLQVPTPFDKPFGMNDVPSLYWGPQKPPAQAPGLGLDVLSTVPSQLSNQMPGDLAIKPPKDDFAVNKSAQESPINKPYSDPFTVPLYKDSPSSLFSAHPLTSLHLGLQDSESPAFIDFTSNGCSVGQRQSTKSSGGKPEATQTQRDLLGEFYYAML